MFSIITQPSVALEASKSLIGGKAHNLALMSSIDAIAIPEWSVLSKNFFNEVLDFPKYSGEEDLKILSEKYCSFIDKSNLFDKVTDFVQTLDEGNYSVRSSAISEDGSDHSFAGVFHSYLYQTTKYQIIESILKCYKSYFSFESLSYHKNNNLTFDPTAFAVIIQKMVLPQMAGVLFTVDPSSGVRGKFAISSNWGLGEGVVSGECACDEYTYDIHTHHFVSNIANKINYYAIAPNGGSQLQASKKERQDQPTLDLDKTRELVRLGKIISKQYGHPLDIEWAFDGEIFWILQARPLSVFTRPTHTSSDEIVLDNSNIQESFCGVTTPLTFSYANEAYFRVYHQLVELIGLSKEELAKHERRHKNMLVWHQGRVYYNIKSWYDGLLIFPSFNRNKEDMEKMMGVEKPIEFVQNQSLSFKEKLAVLPSMIKAYSRLIWGFININALVEDFTRNFERHYQDFPRGEFQHYDIPALYQFTQDIINNITSEWKAPIINDFYVMTQNGKALRWLKKINLENPEAILNQIVLGEEGIESLAPTQYLLKLSQKILETEHAQYFQETTIADLIIRTPGQCPELYKDIEKYINLYGDRVMGELKLEVTTLREDPSFIYQIIKNYTSLGLEKLQQIENNQSEAKDKTLKMVEEKFKETIGRGKYKKFLKDLGKLIQATKYRENMRLVRTKVFGLSRDIYNEMGNQMKALGLLNNSKDIFFLTLDEIERFIEFRSFQQDFKGLVKLRKNEFEENKKLDPSNHLKIKTLQPFHIDVKDSLTSSDLKGLGCFPGILEKKARVILDMNDGIDLNGEILVTLRTDPGWAPLFPSISGLIVERGSLLSHSAIVAREFGIPTIVAVPEVTKRIKDGELIKMDGQTGEIQKIVILDE